jgi:hypothetical protein
VAFVCSLLLNEFEVVGFVQIAFVRRSDACHVQRCWIERRKFQEAGSKEVKSNERMLYRAVVEEWKAREIVIVKLKSCIFIKNASPSRRETCCAASE